jgi:hypothetical protein
LTSPGRKCCRHLSRHCFDERIVPICSAIHVHFGSVFASAWTTSSLNRSSSCVCDKIQCEYRYDFECKQ